MNNKVEAFRSLIAQQRYYDSFEIKTSMVKYNDNDEHWKITLLHAQLLSGSERSGPKIFEIPCLRVLKTVFDISVLDRMFAEIGQGNTVTILNEEYSLELIDRAFTHDFIVKNKALELYRINYPCRRLFAEGSFTPELIETERYLRDTLPLREGNYINFSHVCESILDISHGTESYGTKLRFLAPLFMGIAGVNFEQNQLRVDLNCYPEDELDKIRVVVYNTLELNDKKILTDFVKVGTGIYSQTIQQEPGNILVRLYHNEQLIDEVVEG